MTTLDQKRIRTEILQVQAAKASLELRVEEMKEEIDRLERHIAVSDAKEAELLDKLAKQ